MVAMVSNLIGFNQMIGSSCGATKRVGIGILVGIVTGKLAQSVRDQTPSCCDQSSAFHSEKYIRRVVKNSLSE